MADRGGSVLAGPGAMLFSAAIFGYFGFFMGWNYTGSSGQFLLFVALLEWTLKGCTVAFGLAALLTFVRPLAGNALFAAAGLIGAILFVVVVVLDALDPEPPVIYPPVLLLVFAAWNGYASYAGLRAVLAIRAAGEA